MDIGQDEMQLFELFAAACEQLNDYSRSLRSSNRFFDVLTGADIRNYKSGWRLEKWIEADLHKGGVEEGGLCACWWLELGPTEPCGLKLEASLSIDPEHAHISLPERTAVTLPEVQEGIAAVVHELQTALEANPEFMNAIAAAQFRVEYLTPYMSLPRGIRNTSRSEVERQTSEATSQGAVVYWIRGDQAVDRSSFFHAIRASLPLAPSVFSSDTWDALSDSILNGLHALDTSRTLIIWSNFRRLAESSPDDFEIALKVLQDVIERLARPELSRGRPKEVSVLLS